MSGATATKDAKAAGNGAAPAEHASLAQALLAAQMEMPAIEPDQENPHFRSKFVSLGHLLSKARPVLNRHGIVLVQAPALADGQFVLQTILLHSSGDKMSFDAPLSPAKNDPQGQGSAITYMRRYAASAALAIADQEDDDGNAATGNGGSARRAEAKRRDGQGDGRSAQMTAAQRRKVNGRAGELGLTESQLLTWVEWNTGQRHPDRVTKDRASELIEMLDGYDDAEAALLEFNVALAGEDERAQKIAAKHGGEGSGS